MFISQKFLVFKTAIIPFVMNAEHIINYANKELKSEKRGEKVEIFILQK